jgi:multiple sugar transport system permease protein
MIGKIRTALISKLGPRAKALRGHWIWSKLKRILGKVVLYFLLIDGAFVFLLPILYMLILSFFTAADLNDPSIRWIPVHFGLANFVTAWKTMAYPSSFTLTMYCTLAAIFGQTLFGSLAGYALARLEFRGRKLLLSLVIMILMIPAQALILPDYVFFVKLGLSKTVWPIILPELLGNGLYGALFVFIFRQVFRGIPKELEDAAAIDGAGAFRTLGSIMAPMAQNAYITVALFSFVFHWNEYTRPMNYLNSETKTLSFALSFLFPSGFQAASQGLNQAVQSAGIILVMAPVILIYVFVQRYFIQGVQLSGIKG